MPRSSHWSSGTGDRQKFNAPPKVGTEFDGPPVVSGNNKMRRPVYTVAAIVDHGFHKNDPTFFQVVFRWYSQGKQRYCYLVESVNALDVGLYTLKQKGRSRGASSATEGAL